MGENNAFITAINIGKECDTIINQRENSNDEVTVSE
jgi:hypothetical protein